jgi:hypothetical protein
MPFDPKKLMKSLTAGHGAILAPHIEAYQQRAKFPETWQIEVRNSKPWDGHFHPSSDAFTPPVDLWLAHKGLIIPRPITPALRRTFDCGHMWHGYIQSMLIEMGLVTPENVERYIVKEMQGPHGPFVGAGTGDLVDVQIPGHGEWLVDIKTMNKVEFEQGASEWTMMKWQAQVSCYMDWLDTEKAIILAICKDSPHGFREYQIIKNTKLLNEIYERWSYVAHCLREDVRPESGWTPPAPELLNPGDSVYDAVIAEKYTESHGIEASSSSQR